MHPDAPIKIKCGQCIGCKMKHSQDWAIRLTHEAQYHAESIFLTLTFSDGELAKRHNPGSLHIPEVQKFVKRLRKHLSNEPGHSGKIRYFAVGEYGEKNGRPHYHLLIFGWRPTDARRYRRSPRGSELWNSATLERLWPYGWANFGDVTWDSASYCAGYVTKKFNHNSCGDRLQWVDPLTGATRDKIPEFAIMSLKPALGQQWIEDNWQDAYGDDYVIVKGKKRSLPRFYDKWYAKKDPDHFAEIQSRRELEFKKQPHIDEERRVDMHLAKWHHHSQRLREAQENDGTDDFHDLRQQSESVPKAILHAKRRYRYSDADGNGH